VTKKSTFDSFSKISVKGDENGSLRMGLDVGGSFDEEKTIRYRAILEKVFSIEAKKDKKQINQLEKELRRKDKALAETAALLVLRKKANAIWGEDEDE
jgi:hypothetical protein